MRDNANNDPLVSVIMPCYNDGQYIQESINSVLCQTYPNIELIIINDGSTDPDTNIILDSIAHDRIRVLHTKNLRPAGARNIGIADACGKYIMPVDSDDLISKDYIEKAVRIIESDDSIGVVYCRADLFGEQTGRWNLPDYSFKSMLLDNIVFVTALFKKNDWEKVGGFSTEMDNGMEDYDFWLSILELRKTIYQIPEVLFHYRIKSISRTTEFQKNGEIVQEIYRKIYYRHKKFYEEYRDEYALVLREALIDQTILCTKLKKSFDMYEKIIRIPGIKWLVKNFIH